MASPDTSSDAAPADARARTLHQRVAQDLQLRIRRGEWPVGSTLPSEAALCSQAGVSRHTLRHALRQLQERGLIERRQGAASKVISRNPPRVFSQDYNTLHDVLRYPRTTVRENREEGYIECDAALQARLKVPAGSSWFHIGAVRREEASGLALAWTDIYIQPRFARVARLPGHEREMVFEQIERHFDVAIERAEIEVQADTLNAAHASLLGVAPGTPCLVIIRRYFDPQGEPFEITVTRHPQNLFTFSLELRSISRAVGH